MARVRIAHLLRNYWIKSQLTNLYWEYEFSGHEKVSTMAILGVALGVANAALPMQAINEALFSMEKVIDEIVPVDVAEYNFLTVNFGLISGLFSGKSCNILKCKD